MIVERWPHQPVITTRRDSVEDRWFGLNVPDPYRWLEDGNSPEVKAWISEQNALTEAVLARADARPKIRRRLQELLAIGSISLPVLRRTRSGQLRLFFAERTGAQEQPVLYYRDGIDGVDRVLLDVNTQTRAGATALDWFEPSLDGSLLAYGTSQSGSEDSLLLIREVVSQKDLLDRIEHTRYASIAWRPDNRRFFYSRYPEAGSVPPGEERLHRRIYEHHLGADPARDSLIFGADLEPTDFPGCSLSPNGRWLVVLVSRSWSEQSLYLADLSQQELRFERITPSQSNRYRPIVHDHAIFVVTDEDAPRSRVFAVDPREPAREKWRSVLPEHPEDAIADLDVFGSHLLVSYLHQGASRLEHFGVDGSSRGAIPLDELGSSDGFSGLPEGPDAFFAFESFAVAPRILHLDLSTGKRRSWKTVNASLKLGHPTVELLWATSPDGTRIPYHLVTPEPRDPRAKPGPTLLYGYGGFNQNVQPRFSRSLQLWLEQGGVYVEAMLRGGGEFGEDWHRAGQLDKKQNTFDDFISVAEDLIGRGITDSSQLAIRGRSNGGLLVAAALTQRPDLFRAASAGVPLTDMLRYPRFLLGKLWVSEYGSPEDERLFPSLLAYSPYHRVLANTAYPAVLVTTADSDTRVDPLHARKFVAALQWATRADHPILLRTEREAGHGAGKPISLQLEELTDEYAFLFLELRLPAWTSSVP